MLFPLLKTSSSCNLLFPVPCKTVLVFSSEQKVTTSEDTTLEDGMMAQLPKPTHRLLATAHGKNRQRFCP